MALPACAPEPPAELREAAEVVHHLMKPDNLARSAFSAAFPDPRPSQFVSFIFSDMGVAEWPGAGGLDTDEDRERLRAVGVPVPPADVAFLPLVPDPTAGKQLVVGFDDQRDVVVVEGYLDPDLEPVLRREWKLPRVLPAPGVVEVYRSALEMGFSSQAF